MEQSVVTVTRNDLARLKRSWDSIAQQDSDSFEWVVLDGASSDGTAEWLSSLKDERLRFRSEPDDGIYDAMNRGLDMAEGKLVTFLNAGDYYLRDSVLSDASLLHQREGWAWGHGGAVVVDSQGRPVRPVTRGYPGRLRYAFGRNVIIHQSVFAETEVLRSLGGFDLRFPIGADFHLSLRLSEASPPYVWKSVDVAFEAGGLSDVDHHRALVEGHRIRVDAFGMNRIAATADSAWTVGLGAYIYSRRNLKLLANRVLGPRAISWWSRR